LKDYALRIKKNTEIAPKIFEMTLTASEKLPLIKAGQFLHIETPGKTLRRPFCIADLSEKSVTIAYAVVGEGTEILSHLLAGTILNAALPLGNGFPAENYRRVMLVGGGLGILPLLPLLKLKNNEFAASIGFASADKIVYADRFIARCGPITIRTDDGSAVGKGFPTDGIKEAVAEFGADAVFACGPENMFRALKKAGITVPVFVSVEVRMGCGTGACLVCTCRIKRGDSCKNLRVCADGPVFELEELVL